MKKSSKDKFLQYEIHGGPKIYFDKIGIVKNDSVDKEAFLSKIEVRLEELKVNFQLFQILTLKELNRGNDIEALIFYMNYTYRPLVEVLRMKYCPFHYKFYSRYIHHELPADVVKRLCRLAFTSDAEGLRKNRKEAEEWFWEIASGITHEEFRRQLGLE